VTKEAPEADDFLALVATAQEGDPALSPLQAAILVAAQHDIASDSRSFARLLGVEHALVLRELLALAERGDVLTITKRDPRTLRSFYQLLASDT
jgi:hypothetical protein